MKILTILTFYRPHWTGLTAHAVRVAEELARRGHQVTVLTTRHAPDLARSEIVNGVRVDRLQPVARVSRGMLAPAFPWAAARHIAESDVVQIHTPLPEALLVALLCRALGRPLLMTHHGDVVMPAGLGNRLVEGAAFVILWAAARLADRVTSYSRDYAQHSALLNGLADKLTYVYPPVDLPEPDPGRAAAWRTGLGLDGRLLIGFAGRWVEEKGFDNLLRALPIIRESYPQAHLVYAGERRVAYESFYRQCQPLIKAHSKHLTFLGLLRDPRQMANFYAICDLFVLPSRTDMMALVQVEALLCGTPVVATDIPGARVVVRETGFGRLAPPRDVAGLARTVVESLAERERLRPDRSAVRALFDTRRTIGQYESLFQGLLSPAASGAGASAEASIVRQTDSTRTWSALDAHDHAVLDGILRNEADMAYRRRARVLLDYLEPRENERVLDCGCGMGFYLLALSKLRRLRLVGLDGDATRLARARREGIPAGLLNGQVERLPFADGSFDKVLMSEVLEHLPDDRRALVEMNRVLRPGGILAVSVPNSRYPFWWDPINRTWTALGGKPFRQGPVAGIWSNHERLYEPRELVERIASAGFTVELAEEATHYGFPFSHFIVYGIGKPLLEHGLLPGGLRQSADRLTGERNNGSLLNPINLGVAVFRAMDRLNDRQGASRKRTYVNVLVKARKA